MMAFGFAIERFDLFLRYAAPLAAQQKIAPHGGAFANAAGLAFIVLGIAIIMIAGWRFVQTAKDIDSESEVASPGERFDLALSGTPKIFETTGRQFRVADGRLDRSMSQVAL